MGTGEAKLEPDLCSAPRRRDERAVSDYMTYSLSSLQGCNLGVRSLLVLVSALFCLGSPLNAQETRHVSVPPTPTCPDCRIELDTVAVLSGPVSLGPHQLISKDRHGHFYVLPTGNPSPVLVYSSDGRFLRTLSGSSRDGSKEYRLPTVPQFLAGDTMVVYDSNMVRLVTMSPSGTVLRDVRPRIFPVRSAISPSGTWIVVAQKLTREAIGLPLHLLNRDGTVRRSFGAEDSEYSVSRCCPTERIVTFTQDDKIWVAGINRYVLERWDTTGAKSVEITRSAPWFTTWWQARPWYEAPPPPQIASLWYDGYGRIWTLIRVPDPSWADRLWEPPGGIRMKLDASGTEVPDDPRVDFDDVWDTMIEVIDPENGSLVASARFPFYVGYWFFGHGHFWTYRRDEGTDQLLIRRVRLVENGRVK